MTYFLTRETDYDDLVYSVWEVESDRYGAFRAVLAALLPEQEIDGEFSTREEARAAAGGYAAERSFSEYLESRVGSIGDLRAKKGEWKHIIEAHGTFWGASLGYPDSMLPMERERMNATHGLHRLLMEEETIVRLEEAGLLDEIKPR